MSHPPSVVSLTRRSPPTWTDRSPTLSFNSAARRMPRLPQYRREAHVECALWGGQAVVLLQRPSPGPRPRPRARCGGSRATCAGSSVYCTLAWARATPPLNPRRRPAQGGAPSPMLGADPATPIRHPFAGRPPPPPSCTDWTRLVLLPVLTGHVSSSQAAAERRSITTRSVLHPCSQSRSIGGEGCSVDSTSGKQRQCRCPGSACCTRGVSS